MSRKLISFLGAGNYQTCPYSFGERKSDPAKYVQLPMAQIFDPDHVIVFTTQQAYAANYVSSDGLKASAVRMGMGALFKNVDIPDGTTPAEIWEIFNAVLGQVDERDEIVFDITLSFRSIPVISLACLQYVRALRDVSLRGVYYGAFEARERNKGVAPIFDLTPFVELMDWSQAVAEFVKYGQVGLLIGLLEDQVNPRKKASKGTDREAGSLADLGRALKDGVQWLSTCRGRKLYEDNLQQRIQKHIENLKEMPSTMPAFYPLLDKIEKKVNSLTGPDADVSVEVKRGLGAVKWCLDHNLVQQAYTLLQETLVTHYCLRTGMVYQSKKDRDIVSTALAIGHKPREEWDQSVKKHLEMILKVQCLAGPEMLDHYQSLSGIRNDINHAGTLANAGGSGMLSSKIRECYPEIIRLITREGSCRES